MKNIAITPARSGSVGIKNKNIINLNGKPMIFYTLQACYDTVEIDHVVVTTDSDKIASMASQLFLKGQPVYMEIEPLQKMLYCTV
jgi:CMP-N-acetylneuraminic acid synthetase